VPAKPRHTARLLQFAWIAAKFQGLPDKGLPDFLQHQVGTTPVKEDTFDAALDEVRVTSNKKDRRGPAPSGATKPPAANPSVWTDWLRVDEGRLGLKRSIIRIPNDGLPATDLIEKLRNMPGIRQVMVTKEDREILAVAIYRKEEEADDIRAKVEEHASPDFRVRMHELVIDTDEPTPLTWLEIAKHEAEEEWQ
jgi:hypothetical protein